MKKEKKYVESTKEYKIQGSKYADVTIKKEGIHYLYWAIGKLQEGPLDDKERVEIELFLKELIEINDKMNEIK